MGPQSSNAIAALRSEKEQLLSQANRIDQAISLLTGGREQQHRAAQSAAPPKKRTISAELREARSKAQQERWKKFRENQAKAKAPEQEPEPQLIFAQAAEPAEASPIHIQTAEEWFGLGTPAEPNQVTPEEVDTAVAAQTQAPPIKKAKRPH